MWRGGGGGDPEKNVNNWLLKNVHENELLYN